MVCPAFRGVRLLDIMLLSRQEAAIGRRGYPAEFRRRVLDLVTAGRKVVDLARDLDFVS
jgi:transposase-like protein